MRVNYEIWKPKNTGNNWWLNNSKELTEVNHTDQISVISKKIIITCFSTQVSEGMQHQMNRESPRIMASMKNKIP